MKISCVEISTEVDTRVRGILNKIANECKTCLYKNDDNCRGCVAPWARNVLNEYTMSVEDIKLKRSGKFRDNDGTLDARIDRIVSFMKEVRRPVMCNEIDMTEYGDRSLKEFTLHKMMSRGIIDRTKHGNNYVYFLTNKKDDENGK